MADIEKTQAQITEPTVEVTPQVRKRLFGRFGGHTNDLNVLGKELLEKALEFDEAQLSRDALKVRRKLDFIVIPMVCFPLVTDTTDKTALLTTSDDDHIYVELLGQADVSLSARLPTMSH
jgi:hypothetical protein